MVNIMYAQLPSIEWIKRFLKLNNNDLDPVLYLQGMLINDPHMELLQDDIVERIILDAYESSKPVLEKAVKFAEDYLGIYLGRIQKEQLKKYIDYGNDIDFDIFIKILNNKAVSEPRIKELKDGFSTLLSSNSKNMNSAKNEFFLNLRDAMQKENPDRIRDYITFLYSRLLGMNEKKYISLSEIFDMNKEYAKKELSNKNYRKLELKCSDTHKYERFQSIKQFNDYYLNLLQEDKNSDENCSVFYFSITQSLFDKFKDKETFYDFIFRTLSEAYKVIQNHRTLVIYINDIFFKSIDIKWEIYAWIILFGERINSYEEKRSYYHPHEIARDFLIYKYGTLINDEELKELENYFKNKLIFEKLSLAHRLGLSREEIDSFRIIKQGFTFSDCFILSKDNETVNSKEIEFIKNKTELLLVFYKHQIDDRRMPCPVCGSLNVSGNSFSEIGIRSWECKNPLCSERSKTNRGKRFSERTVLMQNAAFDFSQENQIPREITNKWRKDIVNQWKLNDLYMMIIKYYSFAGDTILALNAENDELFSSITLSEKRHFRNITSDRLITSSNGEKYKNFLKTDEFLNRISNIKKLESETKVLHPNIIPFTYNQPHFILGNSLTELDKFQDNTIHNMVTSPPYYNAREYSQWDNLFNYLSDMFNIIKKSYEKLGNGSVFFYNIGDTYGNDNMIVKSKMGERRIPLGAYTIILFKLSGFDLLDNIIWDKGEPQSNRHLNDGNFTPYYQRPANCYEHMFIFKKKGKLHLNHNEGEITLKSNIIKFSPVIKIGKDGENKYGHSAPFPEEVPKLSVLTFTNKEELVLDPFSGSGTTAIVAAINERIGVGIELNESYFSLSILKANQKLFSINVV